MKPTTCSRKGNSVLRPFLAILALLGFAAELEAQNRMAGQDVGIHIAMTGSSGSASFTATFNGDPDPEITNDTGVRQKTITGSGNREDSLFVRMKTDTEYTISLTTSSAANSSKLKMSAPTGWVFFIGSGADLIERDTYFLNVSSSQVVQVRLSPRGASTQSLVAGESTSFSRIGATWFVGLGHLSNGGSAGVLKLDYTRISDMSGTPADLLFSAPNPEVDYYAPGGVLDWIFAPQTLVDVNVLSSTSYELNFYDWTQVGAKTGNQYALSGDPYVTYKIYFTNPTQVRIGKYVGTKIWWTRIVSSGSTWTVYDWTDVATGLETAANLRKVVTTVSGSGSWSYEVAEEFGRSSPSASFVKSSSTRYSYYKYAWGWELDRIEEDYGSSDARITDYEYFFSLSVDGAGNYGRLKEIHPPEGGYTKYDYYNDFDKRGMLSIVKRPFENVAEGDRTFYFYELDVTGNKFVPDYTFRQLIKNGVHREVARTNYTHTNLTRNNFAVRKTVMEEYVDGTAANALKTTTMTYREDIIGNDTSGQDTGFMRRGMPYAVIRPDGSQTVYTYRNYTTVVSREIIEGMSINPGMSAFQMLTYHAGAEDIEDIWCVPGKTTKRHRNSDLGGRVFHDVSAVAVGGTNLFDLSVSVRTDFDATSRVIKHKERSWRSNTTWSGDWRTIYEAAYSDLRLDWTKDETGSMTDYVTYDSMGRPTRVDDVGATSAVPTVRNYFYYDGSNRTTKHEVRNTSDGSTLSTSLTYDYAGRPLSVVAPGGDTTTYSYPTSGAQNWSKVTNPDGGYVTTTIFQDGSLASRTGTATTPLYAHTTIKLTGAYYSVEKWSALASFAIGDPTTGMVGWSSETYDQAGRLKETLEPTYSSSAGRRTEFSYNALGQLFKRKAVNASTGARLIDDYLYVYDSLGAVVLEGLDVGNGGSLIENSSDRLTKRAFTFYEDAASEWWSSVKTYAYPSASAVLVSDGRFKLATVPGTLDQSEVLDQFGNKVSTVSTVDWNNATVTVTTSYSPGPTNDTEEVYKNGLLTSSKDLDGLTRYLTYDDVRRLKTATGPDSQKREYEYYSGTDRLFKDHEYTSATAKRNLAIYTYTQGRLSNVQRRNTHFGGSLLTENVYYDYDGLGNLTSTWGDGMYPVNHVYDSYGALLETYQEQNSTKDSMMRYEYDSETRLLVKRRSYNGGGLYDNVEYQFDDMNRTSRRDHDRGVYTTYTYSSSTGDLTKDDHSDSTTDVTYDEYDRMGRLKKVTDATGQRSITYSGNNGLSVSLEDLNNLFYGSGRDIAYSYEASGGSSLEGRYKGLTYDGKYWGFGYSATTGRIDKVNAVSSTSPYQFAVSYSGGRVSAIDYGSYHQTRTYDAWSGGVKSVSSLWGAAGRAQFQDIDLSWMGQIDRVKLKYVDGNSLAAKYGKTSDITMTYTYDKVGQLLSYNTDRTAGVESTYAYDLAGNRSSSVDINGSLTFKASVHNEMLHMVSQQIPNPNYDYQDCNQNPSPTVCDPYIYSSVSDYLYDEDGNMTGDGEWTYAYDANDRVKLMTRSSGSVRRMEFTYDYMGRRVQKITRSGTSSTSTIVTNRKFVYDGMTLIAELSGSGTRERSYYWGPDKSSSVGGAGGAMGLLMVEDTAGTGVGVYYATHDHSGNLVGLLNSSGAFAAWYEYDAFGNLVQVGGSYGSENPIGFSGQYTDRESNLSYYGFRFYDPAKGRFITRDPIGEAGGLNLYRFVDNDPVNSSDILGLTEGMSEANKRLAEFYAENGGGGWNWQETRDYGNKGQDGIWGEASFRDPVGWVQFYDGSGVPDGGRISGLSNAEVNGLVDFANDMGYARIGSEGSEGGQRSNGDRQPVLVERGIVYNGVYYSNIIQVAGDLLDRPIKLLNGPTIEDLDALIMPEGRSVGEPGSLESLIPIWGSARSAINHFQNGRWFQGSFQTAMAVSDVFLVKSIATMASKGLWKFGSHSWGATRKWLGKRGYADKYQHVHHGVVEQASYRGTQWESLFNQPWNLKPLNPKPGYSMDQWHKMIEGKLPGLNPAERWWYGTPDWIRYVEMSYGGRLVETVSE